VHRRRFAAEKSASAMQASRSFAVAATSGVGSRSNDTLTPQVFYTTGTEALVNAPARIAIVGPVDKPANRW
jgi:hypothetical protein